MVFSGSDASALDRVLFRLLLATFESDSPPKVLKYELDLVYEMLNYWRLPSSTELLSAHGLYHDDEDVATRTLQVLRKAKSMEKEAIEQKAGEPVGEYVSQTEGITPPPLENTREPELPSGDMGGIRRVYALEEAAEQEGADQTPQAPPEEESAQEGSENEPMKAPLEELNEAEEGANAPFDNEEAPPEVVELESPVEVEETQELEGDTAEQEPSFDEGELFEGGSMGELMEDEGQLNSPFEGESSSFDGRQLDESIFEGEEDVANEGDVANLDNALDRLRVLKEKYLRREPH